MATINTLPRNLSAVSNPPFSSEERRIFENYLHFGSDVTRESIARAQSLMESRPKAFSRETKVSYPLPEAPPIRITFTHKPTKELFLVFDHIENDLKQLPVDHNRWPLMSSTVYDAVGEAVVLLNLCLQEERKAGDFDLAVRQPLSLIAALVLAERRIHDGLYIVSVDQAHAGILRSKGWADEAPQHVEEAMNMVSLVGSKLTAMEVMVKRLKWSLHPHDRSLVDNALSVLTPMSVKTFTRFRTPEPVQVATRFRPEYDPEDPDSMDEIKLARIFPQPNPMRYGSVATWIPPTPIIMGIRPDFPRVSEIRIQGLAIEHTRVLALMHVLRGKDVDRVTAFRVELFETWIALAQDLEDVNSLRREAFSDEFDGVELDEGEGECVMFQNKPEQTKGRHRVINGHRRLVHAMIRTFTLIARQTINTDTRRDSDQTLLTLLLFDQMLSDGWPSELHDFRHSEEAFSQPLSGTHSIHTFPDNAFVLDIDNVHLMAGYINLALEIPDLARLTVEPGEELGDGVWTYYPSLEPPEWQLPVQMGPLRLAPPTPLPSSLSTSIARPEVTNEQELDVQAQLEAMTNFDLELEGDYPLLDEDFPVEQPLGSVLDDDAGEIPLGPVGYTEEPTTMEWDDNTTSSGDPDSQESGPNLDARLLPRRMRTPRWGLPRL